MIHDEIVTNEVAKLAKEKGFDMPTLPTPKRKAYLPKREAIAKRRKKNKNKKTHR